MVALKFYIMSDSPVITRLFNRLPEALQETIRDGIKRSEILLLLRFYFGKDNILREKGWFDSEKRGVPVDGDSDPTPWYSYPMIDFLGERLTDKLRVFEYGGGYSTLWYADKVGNVVAVEDSEKWTKIVTRKLPNNGNVVYQASENDYTNEVLKHDDSDIIVIDGSYRTECVEPSLEALSDNGVIIWDDFEWLEESEYENIIDEGFSVLPLHGLKALGANYKCTAIFYRENNCLGI
jgi:hypothetical protein